MSKSKSKKKLTRAQEKLLWYLARDPTHAHRPGSPATARVLEREGLVEIDTSSKARLTPAGLAQAHEIILANAPVYAAVAIYVLCPACRKLYEHHGLPKMWPMTLKCARCKIEFQAAPPEMTDE